MSGSSSGDDAFAVVASTVTHEGVLATLRVDQVAMPDGSVVEREVADRPDAVAVVALDDDDAVVFVRQYRHAIASYSLEIPAGLLDVDGEAPRDAAARELIEETGLRAGWMREVVAFYNSAGWTAEATTVYVAGDLVPASADGFVAEAEEADMRVVRIDRSRALEMVRTGEIRDAKTVIGLLMIAHDGVAT